MLNLDGKKFLTEKEIKQKAPSVFTKNGLEGLSEKYTHIPTSRVILDMKKLGWEVIDVKEIKARKRVGFQKHLLIFRNENITVESKDGDNVFPQILLSNSHDGTSAFKFQAGIFRMVCENGLVVSTEQFGDISIRHMGYTFEELQSQIKEMVERLPSVIEVMNKMKSTPLNLSQKKKFAKKALLSRFSTDEIEGLKIDINDLISPTREEDKGDDIWSVFNVVQEKIIGGGFNYFNGSKIRKARTIKNFQQDIKVNSKLFETAVEFVK